MTLDEFLGIGRTGLDADLAAVGFRADPASGGQACEWVSDAIAASPRFDRVVLAARSLDEDPYLGNRFEVELGLGRRCLNLGFCLHPNERTRVNAWQLLVIERLLCEKHLKNIVAGNHCDPHVELTFLFLHAGDVEAWMDLLGDLLKHVLVRSPPTDLDWLW